LKIKFLNTFLFILFLSFSFASKAQDSASAKHETNSVADTISLQTEQLATYPGGPEAWRNYLMKKLNRQLPYKNGAPSGKWRVTVRFVINTNGELTDVVAENDPGFGLATEAVRIIKESGTWKPAIQRNRVVKSTYRQPISWIVE
jgi:protein TonB